MSAEVGRAEAEAAITESDDVVSTPMGSRQRLPLSGVFLGIFAAVGYTLTNMALRKADYRNDFDWACWVSMHKALVPASLAWLLCFRQRLKGKPGFPPRELLPELLLTALVMQFGGNILLQLALGRIGLAVTVPLAMSTIIVTGGLMGRFLLNEPVSQRTVTAMTMVIGSIVLLNSSAIEMAQAITGELSWQTTLVGVAAACGAGFSYGFGGAMIRRAVSRGAPVYAPVLVISSTGAVLLGSIGLLRLGWETVSSVPREMQLVLWATGAFNAFSFFCNCGALKRLPVVSVNLINASQAAMAATAGVIFFHEPPTWTLALGTLLTMLGLIVLGWPRRRC